MSRPPLKYELLAALRMSPRKSISERTLHGVVRQMGIEVTENEFEQACLALVDAGRIDFERGGSNRQYHLLVDEGVE